MIDVVIEKLSALLLTLLGWIGIALVVIGILTFGHDINQLLNTGQMSFSSVDKAFGTLLPAYWQPVAQFVQSFPPYNVVGKILNFILEMSASLLTLILGGIAIYVGFRMNQHSIR